METLFGGLIEFEKKEELNLFIENLEKDDAIKLLESAVVVAQQSGVYTIEESYIIYKSLKKLKENDS
jgi:uncharacterized protein YpbB